MTGTEAVPNENDRTVTVWIPTADQYAERRGVRLTPEAAMELVDDIEDAVERVAPSDSDVHEQWERLLDDEQ